MNADTMIDRKPNSEEKNDEIKKKKKVWFLVILLVVLIVITGLLVLWRLGSITNKYMGHIIETIVVSPDQAQAEDCDLCVRVQDSEENPLPGYEVALHSDVQYAITDEDGFVLYNNCTYGMHTLIVLDDDGSELASVEIGINYSDEITDGTQMYQEDEDGTGYLTVPIKTLLVEIDVILDGDKLQINKNSVTALTSDSWVYTYFGIVQAPETGPVFTAHGALMLTDGTVWMHEGGVLLPDGTYVNTDGELYRDGEQISRSELPDSYELNLKDMTLTSPDGTVIQLQEKKVGLTNGIVVRNDGTALYPDGTIVDNRNDLIITPKGYVIDSDGNITDPNGKPYDKNEIPDGTVVNDDGSITLPDGRIIRKPSDEKGYIIALDEDSDKPSRPIGEEDNASSADKTNSSGNSTGKSTGKKSGTTNSQGQQTEEEEYLYVFDTETDKQWSQLTTVDLFKDGDLIYPGAEGTYDFYIKNGVKGTVTFNLTLEEAYHEVGAVPLEYRLKDKNGYVAGSANDVWLTAEELQAVTVTLPESGIVNYTLEWRWPYERGDNESEITENDQYDMELGNAKNRTHYIEITIHAEAT